MGKIALGFVVYNPPASLLRRMELALNAGWTLFVFDNSPIEEPVRVFCAAHGGCRYFSAGKNVGLGYGMSVVTAQAYYSDHPALLFFDQDTAFNFDTLAFIERFYAMNISMADAYSSVVFNTKDTRSGPSEAEFAIRNVLLAINSGSLYFLENVRKLNWFDETFFVDGVDYEFCLRSSEAKMRIAACVNTPGYDHVTEQDDTSYYVFGQSRRLRRYSRSRVIGSILAMTRLCWAAAIRRNGRYFCVFVRYLFLYFFWQIVVRILIVFPKLGRSLVMHSD